MSREISHNIALAAGFGNEVPLPNDADNDMKMRVSMYSDPAFNEWADAVNLSADATDKEKKLAAEYSDYTLAVELEINKVNGKDMAGGDNSGYGFCIQAIDEVTQPSFKSEKVNRQERPTDKPADTTDGTDKPDDGTDKPDDGTEKPDDGTVKPDDGTDKPDDGTEKPDDDVQREVEENANGSKKITETSTMRNGNI